MVKVGLIGAGKWGTNYIRTLSKLKGIELVWICTKNSEIELPEATFLTHIINDEIYDMVDSIIVATPSNTHYHITKDALLHKKHVLCEKPLTKNVEEALELIELARNQNVILMAGHEYLYNVSIVELRKWIESSLLVPHNMSFSRMSTHIGMDDCVWEMSPHDIYITMFLLDNTEYSIGYNFGDYQNRNFSLTFGNCVASYKVSSVSKERKRHIHISGASGQNEAWFDETSLKLCKSDGTIIKEMFHVNNAAPLFNQCNYFFYAISLGEKPLYVVKNQMSALKTIEILEKLSKSK